MSFLQSWVNNTSEMNRLSTTEKPKEEVRMNNNPSPASSTISFRRGIGRGRLRMVSSSDEESGGAGFGTMFRSLRENKQPKISNLAAGDGAGEILNADVCDAGPKAIRNVDVCEGLAAESPKKIAKIRNADVCESLAAEGLKKITTNYADVWDGLAAEGAKNNAISNVTPPRPRGSSCPLTVEIRNGTITMPTEHQANLAGSKGSDSKPASKSSSSGPLKSSSGDVYTAPLRMQIGFKNPVSFINEVSTMMNWNRPHYVNADGGYIGPKIWFECKVTCRTSTDSLLVKMEGNGKGFSKKDSKARAAADLLSKLALQHPEYGLPSFSEHFVDMWEPELQDIGDRGDTSSIISSPGMITPTMTMADLSEISPDLSETETEHTNGYTFPEPILGRDNQEELKKSSTESSKITRIAANFNSPSPSKSISHQHQRSSAFAPFTPTDKPSRPPPTTPPKSPSVPPSFKLVWQRPSSSIWTANICLDIVASGKTKQEAADKAFLKYKDFVEDISLEDLKAFSN